MNTGKICVSVCAETADETLQRVRKAVQFADVIEVRFDCLKSSEIKPLAENLAQIDKQFLITFRPKDQGGRRKVTLRERLKFWEYILWQLKGTELLVDYEVDIDFPLKLDPRRTIISIHDFQRVVHDWFFQYEIMTELTGKILKIAVGADDVTDAIEIWKLLARAKSENKQIIPIAMGEAGKWTRILGLAHGAFMTYASLESGGETAPGQISAKDLIGVYRVKALDKKTDVYGIIAGDTSYSVSPYLHNAAFKSRGLNSVFIPLQVGNLDEFMRRLVKPETREIELNFKGFSVTNPHKEAIIKHMDFVDDTSQKIGAVNTVKIEDGKFHGYNTDAEGFVGPLKTVYGDLTRAKVALVGAGGAARACIYVLKQAGADVSVFSRDFQKAKVLSEEFNIASRALRTTNSKQRTIFSDFDIIVNATPLGTKGELENETVATAEKLQRVKLVYDLVYNPAETRLIREAKAAGIPALGGLEMLIAQGAKQFEIWTGQDAPVEEMRAAVRNRLNP